MTVRLIVDNVQVPVKHIRFSDGSSNVKLEWPEQLVKHPPSAYYSVSVDPTTPADNYIWEIFLVVTALNELLPEVDFKKRILHLPYLPHARADRVFEKGNSAPLELFIAGINGLFNEVFLTDPHSDFAVKKLGSQAVVKPQHDCFLEVVKGIVQESILISPDKGALNKIYKLQNALFLCKLYTAVIEASKKRDIETGRIIGTVLNNNLSDIEGKICYIVDDICDGGGTFLPLADKLKEQGAKEVHLYVTHGIFAKGLNIFKGKIDKLHIYQTVGTFVNSKDILDFNNGLEVK